MSPPEASVGGAANALAALVSQDLQQGTIDQAAAEQIFGPLRMALRSYSAGDSGPALAAIGTLPAQIAQLAARGSIQASSVAGLDSAVGQLQAALERSAPQGSSAGAAQGPSDGLPGGGPGEHGPKGPKANPGKGDGGD